MNVFDNYLANLSQAQQDVLQGMIELIRVNAPDATEGLSYGFPAFKFNDRPLIGFGAKVEVLSLYPFDPRVLSAAKPMLDGYEVGKGFVRFTADCPVPDDAILLMLEMRLNYLNEQPKPR